MLYTDKLISTNNCLLSDQSFMLWSSGLWHPVVW